MQRRRLGSVGDSAPPSESSETTSSEPNDLTLGQTWTTNETQEVQKNNIKNNSSKNMLIACADMDADTVSCDDSGSQTNLSEYERAQVENFFSSLGTAVYVSSSLANLYEGTGNDGDWRLIFTGIPVILHDKGTVRARTQPCVTFVLAERGSAFALWSDRIDNLTDYRMAGPSFHTMRTSTNHQQLIGFSFDSSDSAQDLWQHIEKLISDPENITLSVPGGSGRKKQKSKHTSKRTKPAPLPPKSQISLPCQFQHVNSVTRDDVDRYYSMQAFAPAKPH